MIERALLMIINFYILWLMWINYKKHGKALVYKGFIYHDLIK